MDTLISIMLFINVISPSGHYTVDEINVIAANNSAQITAIENNPPQLDAVLQEEEPDAIWVIDNLGG